MCCVFLTPVRTDQANSRCGHHEAATRLGCIRDDSQTPQESRRRLPLRRSPALPRTLARRPSARHRRYSDRTARAHLPRLPGRHAAVRSGHAKNPHLRLLLDALPGAFARAQVRRHSLAGHATRLALARPVALHGGAPRGSCQVKGARHSASPRRRRRAESEGTEPEEGRRSVRPPLWSPRPKVSIV